MRNFTVCRVVLLPVSFFVFALGLVSGSISAAKSVIAPRCTKSRTRWASETAPNFSNFISNGIWTGANGIAQVRAFDGPTAVLNSDGTHIWPYGLNYDTPPCADDCGITIWEFSDAGRSNALKRPKLPSTFRLNSLRSQVVLRQQLHFSSFHFRFLPHPFTSCPAALGGRQGGMQSTHPLDRCI